MKSIKVIKVGGRLIEDETMLEELCIRLAEISQNGPLIVIHGGGLLAGKIASRMGIETHMHDGRRITDAATLDITVMAYAGLANKKITAGLQSFSVNACGLSGCDMGIIRSHKRPVREIDWGFVGDIDTVNTDAILDMINQGVVPVISPITFDTSGQLLNTNADSVASAVAVAIGAHEEVELIYCMDKPGVLTDPEDYSSVIPVVDRELFEELMAEGAVHSGMIPKLENAFGTLEKGVASIRITNVYNLNGGTKIEKQTGK